VAKKKVKKKNKSFNLMIGAVMKWECADPMVERPVIIRKGISHRNAITRLRLKNVGIREQMKDACENPNLKWSILATGVFKDPFGTTYMKPREMIYRGKLSQATPSFDKMQLLIFTENNMDHYITTELTAEILGTSGIKNEDFDARPKLETLVYDWR
tara:strand:- start:585 stop:1055 length:471 start_codon:yes stop_codon:yes gene_type:complete